ncbi:hypothetical protein, partial [Streptomyces sp. NPDC058663]|uniref:hypothetical protein n=1 Tax=Streptomyces sp. NPDC058663 TaxID=3346584 RepID=UPI00365206F0
QVAVVPSPMVQAIEVTVAVAETVTPPAVAVAEVGPYVTSVGSTHIHTGSPSRYGRPTRGLTTFGPPRRAASIARCRH